jgi:hypothetical protein
MSENVYSDICRAAVPPPPKNNPLNAYNSNVNNDGVLYFKRTGVEC